jgi:transcriptional regulator GlxA family with amidase domain
MKSLVGTLLFEGFELLDAFGPLELFLSDSSLFASVILGMEAGEVASNQGPKGVIEQSLFETGNVDILLLPGGRGVRRLIEDASFLEELKRLAGTAQYICSVCTGAVVLARAGLLDGRKATTNKSVWAWATSQGGQVNWVPEARWVVDGPFYTSSGVTAGMDMALALIEAIHGPEKRIEVARYAEYEWHSDPRKDPFAKLYGLAP